MKTLKDFITFTNLYKNQVKLIALLILASILYSIMVSFVDTIIYMGNLVYYYGALYLFVIWTAYIYMIITFIFLQKKRGIQEKLTLKAYIGPLLGVQSIFYIMMLVLGVGAHMYSVQWGMLSNVINLLAMCFLILYIPWQLFCFFQIYDGVKNPFRILWNGIKTIIMHYRSCFYALLSVCLFAVGYEVCMNALFGITSTFSINHAVQDIMIHANPMQDALHTILFVGQHTNLWMNVIISFLYGCCMCVLLVYYIMFTICTYDKDIKV